MATFSTLSIFVSAFFLSALIVFICRRSSFIRHGKKQANPNDTVSFLGHYSPILTWMKYGHLPEIKSFHSPELTAHSRSNNRYKTKLENWLQQPLPLLPMAAARLIKVPPISIMTGILLFTFNAIIWKDLTPGCYPISLFLIVIGILFFGIGILRKIHPLAEHQTPVLSFLTEKFHITTGQAICLLISPAFAFTAGLASLNDPLLVPHPHIAAIAWGLAILLAVTGGIQLSQNRKPLFRLTLLTVGIFVFVAFLLRIVDLEHLPVLWSGDEASVGLIAVNFLSGKVNNLFGIGYRGFPAFYSFIQTFDIAILGQTFTALRLSSALAGAFSVGAIYLLGRTLFNQRTGVIAAILLLGYHFQFHFSRFGINNIWDSLSYTVVIGAVWYGWSRENRLGFLLAGLLLGLSQYFYLTSHVLPLLIALWLLMTGFREPERVKRMLPDIFLMGFIAFLVILPLAWVYLLHPGSFFYAAQQKETCFACLAETNGNTLASTIFHQFQQGFGAFVAVSLKGEWYMPGSPLLRTIPALFFIIGLVALILHIRDARTHLLVLWLLAFGLMVSLSESPPAAQRYVGMASACVLIEACGIQFLFSFMGKRKPSWAPGLARIAIIAAVLLAADDLRFYFFEYTPESYYLGMYSLENIHSAVAQPLTEFLSRQADNPEVLFFSEPSLPFDSITTIQYAAPKIKGIDIPNAWGSPGNPQPTSAKLIFVFLPSRMEELSAVQQTYPGGVLQVEHGHFGEILYYLYQYP